MQHLWLIFGLLGTGWCHDGTCAHKLQLIDVCSSSHSMQTSSTCYVTKTYNLCGTTCCTGARSLKDCVNGMGYYYKPGPNQRAGSNEAARLAVTVAAVPDATATNSSDGLPAAIPCPPDTYNTGLNYEPTCIPCPEGFQTDPASPAGSLTSIAVCLAPPGSYIDPDLHTVVSCEPGTFSDAYNNDTACTPCSDATGATGIPLGPGITTAGAGASSVAECRALEPGFALVDDEGLAILGVLKVNQVGGVM